MKIGRLGIVFGIGLVILLCGIVMPVSAENNTTITNETMPYSMSEQYQKDVQDWYDYYIVILGNATGTTKIKDECLSVLLKSDIDWDSKMSLIKPILGWDYRLAYYMDETKRTINDETGAVSYDLGFGNWWAQRFGSGVQESSLPQTMAEGDALYRIYTENYEYYVQALREAGNP